MFRELLFWDKVLIVFYIIFALSLICGIVYVNVPVIQTAVRRKLIHFAERVEEFNRQMNDDEPFDANWMDYPSWKESRIAARKKHGM